MKKMAILSVAASILASCTVLAFSTNAQMSTVRWGDIDEDGQVSLEDAMLALQRYTQEFAGNQVRLKGNWSVGDVNRDGYVDLIDAQEILKKYVCENLSKSTYFFEVESPIAYEEVRATKEWNVYLDSNNAYTNLIGKVKAGDTFKIKEYEGDGWYNFTNDHFNSAYINIPSYAWKVDFFYAEDYSENQITTIAEETTTTTAETTTAETTTKETAKTTTTATTTNTTTKTTTTVMTTTKQATTVTATTISKETKATAQETATSTNKTTETSQTTTAAGAVTTEPKTVREFFKKGDKVEFTATAWCLYDFNYARARYLSNSEQFTIIKADAGVESDRYVIEIEDKQYIIYIGDTKFFNKID